MRLYRIKDDYGDNVDIKMKGYPLIPGDIPGRLVAVHSMQSRMKAGADALENEARFVPWPDREYYPSSSMPALEAAMMVKDQNPDLFQRFDLALFKAFFEECRDISQMETLLEVAEESGVNKVNLENQLTARTYRPAVISDFMECLQKYGKWAQGIPLISFNGSPPLVGCAPLGVYRTAIERHVNPAAALGV